jgi:LL-diaminopimelate aminotransferase
MALSKRLDLFADEVFAALNAQRRLREQQGKPVFDLSVGTPDFSPAPHVINALIEAAKEPENWKYSLHDTDELIAAVCGYYQRRYNVKLAADEVMGVHGTQEGMAPLAEALVDPGDLVLVPDPCYPVFRAAALLAGAELAYYPLTADHNFLPYVAGISDQVADRAKYMVVSLPANPVGSVGTAEIYAEIISFAQAHNIIVVHDNAYSDIIFDSDKRGGSFLAYPGAREVGVEFLSLSKSFNVTGARLSFLVGRSDIVAAVRKIHSQTDFGTFLPEQAAAIACLTGPLDGVEQQRLAYQKRRDVLADGLESLGWQRPNACGTLFVWEPLPAGKTDSVKFCMELMDKSGVIVTPGASFGPAGEGYIRFALVVDPERIRQAIEAIRQAGMSAGR